MQEQKQPQSSASEVSESLAGINYLSLFTFLFLKMSAFFTDQEYYIQGSVLHKCNCKIMPK